jgi:bacterioferritin-associated ferredoxin
MAAQPNIPRSEPLLMPVNLRPGKCAENNLTWVISMIICSCNVLTDQQVRASVKAADRTPITTGQVYKCMGCSPKCGRCARTVRLIAHEALGCYPKVAS